MGSTPQSRLFEIRNPQFLRFRLEDEQILKVSMAPEVQHAYAMEITRMSQVTVDPDWQNLDRQDWHLWMLAVLLVFVLGTSLLAFMFPTAFWFQQESIVTAPQRAFFGFCVLLALVVVYMLQRQAAVRTLKRQLYRAQTMAAAAEQEAILRVLGALPDVSQFQDSLAMEYLRATRSGGSLSAVFLSVPGATAGQRGVISFMLHMVLRSGESLFRISDHAFAIILPGSSAAHAASFAEGLADRIRTACEKLSPQMCLRTFPEQVTSFAEFESALRNVVEPPMTVSSNAA